MTTGPAREWDAATYHRVSTPQQEWGRAVLERVRPRGDEVALDAGCGSGVVTAALLEVLPRGRVLGLDRSLAMLRQAHAHLGDAVVYVEAGYSDANRPKYTARVLNAIGIRKIRGFYTNDTHEQWAINEIRWAERVSRRTHGAHFIVNTAQDGRGPKLNKHPGKHGVEDLCNPPGRGLGPPLNTNTGYPNMDAFMWTHTPGRSSGTCNGGPPSGNFWVRRAIMLASRATIKLGPAFHGVRY